MYYYLYRITNTINGKTYIGQRRCKNLEGDKYMGSGTLLRKAQLKYGIENFIKDVLIDSIKSKEELNKLEKHYIKLEKDLGKGEYNITEGGEGFCAKHREDSKLKISNSLIGNSRCKGKNLNNKNALGNILSAETRANMTKAKKGNSNNGVKYLKCIETGEVYRVREWILKGFSGAYLVAQGHRPHCKNLHFEYTEIKTT